MIPGVLSMYRFCTALTDPFTGQLYLTDPAPFAYQELDDTREHTVSDGDTWESIAGKYYRAIPGGAELWPVIAAFQPHPPMDASVPPERGAIVYVPSERTIFEVVFNEARRVDYEA